MLFHHEWNSYFSVHSCRLNKNKSIHILDAPVYIRVDTNGTLTKLDKRSFDFN